MAERQPHWDTAAEAAFLRDLANEGKLDALRGWLRAAMQYERDWNGMDSATLIGYARELLQRPVEA